MIQLYPPAKSFNEFYLDVGDGHQLYVVQSGNPQGRPVFVLHPGPGGRSKEKYRAAP